MASDYEPCPRCGAYLLSCLTQFHICEGTNTLLRPANIPLERWHAMHGLLMQPPPVVEPPAQPPVGHGNLERLIEESERRQRRRLTMAFATVAVVVGVAALLLLADTVAFWMFVEID